MTKGHVLRFENREKFNAQGKWIAHLRVKSRRKRRLRSEPRLRVQSAMIFACGKNPCTAHMRRPAVRGPDRCLQLFCRNKAQQESW